VCAVDRFFLQFALDLFGDEISLEPVDRWNFPQKPREILRREKDGRFKVSMAGWGLVPRWSKDGKVKVNTFNARDDSLQSDKPMFRAPFERQRCLLIATSFVEYADRSGRKAPIEVIPRGGHPYFYAGLWDSWGHGDEEIETCAMVTTEPNELISPIHSRMPAILDEEEALVWLSPDAPRSELLGLLRPFSSKEMSIRDAQLPPRQSSPSEQLGFSF
jgi:putative SOS response-associated peptidase YedK